jgi:hypothetical protein
MRSSGAGQERVGSGGGPAKGGERGPGEIP